MDLATSNMQMTFLYTARFLSLILSFHFRTCSLPSLIYAFGWLRTVWRLTRQNQRLLFSQFVRGFLNYRLPISRVSLCSMLLFPSRLKLPFLVLHLTRA